MRFLILIILLRHFYYDIRKRVWDKSLTLNIKSEQNKLSDTQNSVLFAFLSNLSILKIYNKEFLKSKSFCPSLVQSYLSRKNQSFRLFSRFENDEIKKEFGTKIFQSYKIVRKMREM